MKIISKYKDYYDYLQGLYGIDEKIVLDRRTVSPIEKLEFKSKTKVYVYLCGMVYEGWYDGKRFYWGEELYEVGEKRKYFKWSSDNSDKREVEVKVGESIFDRYYIATVPYKDKHKYNDKKEYPILVSFAKNVEPGNNVPLKTIEFHRVLPAEKIFMELTNWLSQKITEKENYTDTRTEEQKIESRGFDRKRSFRPKMKK